jgi:hypothetical protein
MTNDQLALMAANGRCMFRVRGRRKPFSAAIGSTHPESAVAIGGRRLLSAICYLRFSTVAIRSSNGRPQTCLLPRVSASAIGKWYFLKRSGL